jgi:hypothetical protein
MDYHIEVKSSEKGKWQRIASFETLQDRDDCIDVLAEKYDDVAFRKIDE